jgi:hypothetical protein
VLENKTKTSCFWRNGYTRKVPGKSIHTLIIENIYDEKREKEYFMVFIENEYLQTNDLRAKMPEYF